MYKALIDFLRQEPEPYAGSTSKFWDDSHIAEYMLEAHLNPDTDSASRRHEFIKESARWIASVAETANGKKLLDLGCGAGIYAEAFEDAGFLVTGIDIARHSLDYAEKSAREKHKNITYLCQSYLEMDYQNKFDAITLIFCDFGVLSPQNRADLLLKIKKALKPGGFFIVDVFTQAEYKNFADRETKASYSENGFWSKNPYACIERKFRYKDMKTFLEQYIVVTDEKCDCYNIWNYAFDQESLGNELRQAGFTEIAYYGDVCGKPFACENKTLCAVAR